MVCSGEIGNLCVGFFFCPDDMISWFATVSDCYAHWSNIMTKKPEYGTRPYSFPLNSSLCCTILRPDACPSKYLQTRLVYGRKTITFFKKANCQSDCAQRVSIPFVFFEVLITRCDSVSLNNWSSGWWRVEPTLTGGCRSHLTSHQSRLNAGPPSKTVAQHWAALGCNCR